MDRTSMDSHPKYPGIDVKAFLSANHIDFQLFAHTAVFTCDEAKAQELPIRGIHSKNLFLKDRKSRRFYLVIAPDKLQIEMKSLSTVLNERIKFANETDLSERLKTSSGSVSPFCLLNDDEGIIKLIIHKEIMNSDYVSFHPNINTETLELKTGEFDKYLKLLNNPFEILSF